MDIGIIGHGAIGQTLMRLLAQDAPNVRVAAILEQPAQQAAARARVAESTRVVTSVEELVSTPLQLVIECAGHAALKASGAAVLSGGVDLLVASVGALAEPMLEAALREAAGQSGARLRIPSGALGGLDVLGAARLAGLDVVTYVSNKAPRAWKGTAAEDMIDLDRLTQPTVFYSGNAREAALRFPQNANVAAAVALAGVGFERTHVELTADPAATGNRHRIRASGAFGEIDVAILGKTLPKNPKTSMLAPYSLVRSVLNLGASALVVG
jgi:aspartate dehydrogenase